MRHSAGVLVISPSREILLVHPGGPFWVNKDEHGWSVPKGEFDPETEDALDCAKREFEEELGLPVPEGELIELGAFKASGKTVHVWLLEADLDVSNLQSNEFTMEWPRGSGQMQSFPEVDKAEWFPLDVARTKIHKGQVQIVDALDQWLTMNSAKSDK
jgi:predicted NUDIX family NTP pyrophosphohydrolase